MQFQVQLPIHAPVEFVFETISSTENYSRAVPNIQKVEILSTQQRGIGTKFRETRLMNGRSISIELEVADFVENEKIRIVSDTGGCVWDSTFAVRPFNGGTELLLVMEARPYRLLARIMNLFIRKLIQKSIEEDMTFVKEYCEKLHLNRSSP